MYVGESESSKVYILLCTRVSPSIAQHTKYASALVMSYGCPASSALAVHSCPCHAPPRLQAPGAQMPSFSLLVGRSACIGHGLAARLQRRGLRGFIASAGASVQRAAPLASRICALTAAGAVLPQVPAIVA